MVLWLIFDTCIISDLLQPYYTAGVPNFLTEGSFHLPPEVMGLEGAVAVQSLSEAAPFFQAKPEL